MNNKKTHWALRTLQILVVFILSALISRTSFSGKDSTTGNVVAITESGG